MKEGEEERNPQREVEEKRMNPRKERAMNLSWYSLAINFIQYITNKWNGPVDRGLNFATEGMGSKLVISNTEFI